MRIAESELIINGDGSVFHLHLRPEELADNVILVGDPAIYSYKKVSAPWLTALTRQLGYLAMASSTAFCSSWL